jgi:glycosyltransferase involved in cell wall biosynthesis
MVYWKWLKRGIKQRVCISEHWSGYHFNFGLSKKISRIQRIFSHGIPLITVSEALSHDIELYSGRKTKHFVIPNVIDTSIFFEDESIKRENYFFMVSQWKEPKKPLIAIEAFSKFNQDFPTYKLVIAGFGPQVPEMKKLAVSLKNENIEFIGAVESTEIASNLRKCKAFLHPSEYETFSVVCAEASSCGTPSIVSDVGGIPEVLHNNAILLKSFEVADWNQAMKKIIKMKPETANCNFSSKEVGMKYFQVLSNNTCESINS